MSGGRHASGLVRRARGLAAVVAFAVVATVARPAADAQLGKVLHQLGKAEATRVLRAAGNELSLGDSIHYHVFANSEKTYFHDAIRSRTFEVKGGQLDDALMHCDDLLTLPRRHTAIYPSAADSPFVSRNPFKDVITDYFVVRGGRQAELQEVVSSTGNRALVTSVQGQNSILQRASSRLSETELVDRLAAERFSPEELHVVLLYRDTAVEQRLAAIPGIKLRFATPEKPNEVIDAIRAAPREDLHLVLGHSENGMLRTPGETRPGIAGDNVVQVMRDDGRRGFLWGCECGVDYQASGPRRVVDLDEVVTRLEVAVGEKNLLGFVKAMKDVVVLDETILRGPLPKPSAGKGGYKQGREDFLNAGKRNPGLVMPPRRRAAGNADGAPPKDAGGATSEDQGPSDRSDRPPAPPPSRRDAGDDAIESSNSGAGGCGGGTETTVVVLVGVVGGAALFLIARRK